MTEQQQHPITPPPELVREWGYEHGAIVDGSMYVDEYIVIQTSRFRRIADDELEACCKWLVNHFHGMKEWSEELRSARRPKPPSLAEQALAKTEAILNDPSRVLLTEVREALEFNRRTLKRLQELLSNG